MPLSSDLYSIVYIRILHRDQIYGRYRTVGVLQKTFLSLITKHFVRLQYKKLLTGINDLSTLNFIVRNSRQPKIYRKCFKASVNVKLSVEYLSLNSTFSFSFPDIFYTWMIVHYFQKRYYCFQAAEATTIQYPSAKPRLK